jgi:hypothetical protein
LVRGALASQGKPLVALGITDQFGDEYLIKRESNGENQTARIKPYCALFGHRKVP